MADAVVILIAFTAAMTAAILFMVKSVQAITKNADETMDAHNVRHARDMAKWGNDHDVIVKYIVPKERNLWEKLTRRVGVWAWECEFCDGDIRQCKFYVRIPTSSYFYMQLKGWTETSNKELAQNAMDYMKWEREIP